MKKPIRILVVEDNVLISLDIQRSLEALGYSTAGTATTGEDAIIAVEKLSPDLILMDIQLNGELDGIETTEIIKSKYDIPVVYLTAHADEATVERAKLTQPLGYLLKPFEERELSTMLQMALFKHNLDIKLKENERWLFTTLKSIGDGVIATDEKGRIKFLNPVAEELTGWMQEKAIGKKLTDVFKIESDDADSPVINPVERVLAGEKKVELINHTLLEDKFGKKRYISDTASPILNEEGEITGVVLVFQDITTKKIAEIAVKISEEKFRSVFERSAVGMIIFDSNGNLSETNLAFSNFLNYSIEECKNQNIYNLIAPEHSLEAKKILKSLHSNKTNYYEGELQFITKEKKEAWGYSTAVTVKDQKNNYIIMVVQDITQRRNAELALREQEESYRSLTESSIDAIYVLKGKKLLFVNKAWEDLFGFTREEATSDNFDILCIVADESRNEIKERFKNKNLSASSSRYEMKAINKAGEKIDLEVSVSRIWWKGGYAYQGIYRDITKRKMEEDRLKYAIELAERSNKLKNEFLAQMSHEIRTPLNNILTFTSLLKDELQEKLPEGMESVFSIISNSAQRLIRTIESILNLSRIQTGNYDAKFEALDLNKDVLDDLTLEFYLRAKEKNIEIIFNNNSDKSLVIGDKYSVSQIFVNLIDNAIKYTPEGSITINLYNDDHNVIVEIKDTGVGISEEFLPKIFSPFTQEDTGNTRPYEGTGLGLALVSKYADINNAIITVDSKKGEGTTFKIMFTQLTQ